MKVRPLMFSVKNIFGLESVSCRIPVVTCDSVQTLYEGHGPFI